MRILYFKNGKEPEELLISRDLKAMQDLVHGYIENYQVNDKICIVCNEDGWNLGMPVNRLVMSKDGNILQAIRGDFIVCADGGEDYVSLTDEQIRKIVKFSFGNKYPGWIR